MAEINATSMFKYMQDALEIRSKSNLNKWVFEFEMAILVGKNVLLWTNSTKIRKFKVIENARQIGKIIIENVWFHELSTWSKVQSREQSIDPKYDYL